jgi:hypothetical protein
MTKTPAFSQFRELMNLWDESEASVKVKSLIEGNSLVLFFQMEDKVYGAPEGGRVTFAKMKSPDDDLPEGWIKDANFVAYDLGKAVKGEKVERVFSEKDLGGIKVIEQEKAEDLLEKSAKGEPADLPDEEDPTAPDAPTNIDKLDEK